MAPITTLTVTRTKIAACCKQIRMIQSVRTRENGSTDMFHTASTHTMLSGAFLSTACQTFTVKTKRQKLTSSYKKVNMGLTTIYSQKLLELPL